MRENRNKAVVKINKYTKSILTCQFKMNKNNEKFKYNHIIIVSKVAQGRVTNGKVSMDF